eukprot:CAMPEP_0184863222 /NCGR_PEP_ID=MMETSP0580-20130426/9816_1 /TAXON_ID=1118495 /ORGANISM="Dactyliosolen fragilissimus" /LENGTH=396 /DNA_ID=CAMNT_0027361417 /DNA_START=147 /DNA_END=1340 /DNA_ORIENTATION=-
MRTYVPRSSKIELATKSLESLSSTTQTRRKWTKRVVGQIVTASWGLQIDGRNPVHADDTTTALLPPQPFVSATTQLSSLCDPSVSTFRNPDNGRVVHILGTAHISEESAQLAGRIVREVHPEAVFVELDAKRVGRAIPTTQEAIQKNVGANGSGSQLTPESNFSNESSMPNLNGKSLQSNTEPVYSSSTVMGEVATAPTPQPRSNPFNLKEKAMRYSSQIVGDAIKGLYKKLESQGFSAGEEFVIAVREGLAINSKIILGDQDVDITLRRLTEALSKTDLKQLLSADSQIEESMRGLVPDPKEGDMTKEELSYFVETVKAKENVKLIMSNLKAVAPELYNAMVAERDLYMASGINRLDQFKSMVAVMGIAHVEGVEMNLRNRGWVEVTPLAKTCSL